MSGSVYSQTTVAPQTRRAGVATMVIDGDNFDVAGDAVYNAVTVTREGLIGQSGVQGFSEMPKYPYIKAKIRDAGNMTVALFMAKTNSSITLYLANGKVVSGDGLFCQECSEVATQEATFEVTFYGQTIEETAL